MALMFQPFRRMFDFKGRARRKEWGLFLLLQLAVVAVLFALIRGFRLLPDDRLDDGLADGLLFFMAVSGLPMLALQVRRLHDSDRSGWWVRVSLVPISGWA